MEQYKLFRAALHHYIDGFAPMAVSPAPSARFVFLGKILCVIDEDVGAFGQLAHSLVEGSIAGLIVGGVDKHSFFGFHAEAHASLGMVEPRGLHVDAIFHGDAAALDVIEIAMRRHLIESYGEVRGGHLIGQDLLEMAGARGTLEEKTVLRV